jgi:putative acetyltransferase
VTKDNIDIQIRIAEPADAPSIAAVLHRSFVEFKASYTAEAFAATTPDSEQILSRMNEGPIWIAIRNDEIVGTVSVVSRSEALHIRGMAVLPSARGGGIGKLLMKKVENFASSHNHNRLILSTTPFLDSAIRLYNRMGFRRSDEGPHDLFGTPLFTMEKELDIPED